MKTKNSQVRVYYPPASIGAGDCGHHQFPGDDATDVSELQGDTHTHTHKTHTDFKHIGVI